MRAGAAIALCGFPVVEVGTFDDMPGALAICEEFPQFMGHGDDDDDALADWMQQWHAAMRPH